MKPRKLEFKRYPTQRVGVFRNRTLLGYLYRYDSHQSWVFSNELQSSLLIKHSAYKRFSSLDSAIANIERIHEHSEETRRPFVFRRVKGKMEIRAVFRKGLEIGKIEQGTAFYTNGLPNWLPDEDLCTYLKIPYFSSCIEASNFLEMIDMVCIRAQRFPNHRIHKSTVLKIAEEEFDERRLDITYGRPIHFGWGAGHIPDQFNPKHPHAGVKVILRQIFQIERNFRKQEFS